jgi:hypothetical protein
MEQSERDTGCQGSTLRSTQTDKLGRNKPGTTRLDQQSHSLRPVLCP